MAVVPLAGPPKPPTVTVAEEGKEGQDDKAAQSPTDKDAEAKGEAHSNTEDRGWGVRGKGRKWWGVKAVGGCLTRLPFQPCCVV